MKYGMRERISGGIILIALAVIFVPMLFDEPESREDRPQPTLTIEQPVEIERRDVPAPERPEGLGQIQNPSTPEQVEQGLASAQSDAATSGEEGSVAAGTSSDAQDSGQESEPASGEAAEPATPQVDPIAALARQADERLGASAGSAANAESGGSSQSPPAAVDGGQWAVQVGSFGEAGNAERLLGELRDKGYPAYSRARTNALTTVYVGPYGASEVAEGVMGELKSKVNVQGLLVRVER